jgi:hypothetical protein
MLAWVAAAILLYVLVSYPALLNPRGVVLSALALGSLFTAVTLLIAAWAWMLVRASTSDPRVARRLWVGAALLIAFLAALITIPDTRVVVRPALLLTVPVTLVSLVAARGPVSAWKWVVAWFLFFPLIFSESYFGAVLILIGVFWMPRRVGPYLRELFPRRVGGSP